MTNHPNRGPQGPASTPTPAQVTATREAAGLSQTQAAALVHSTYRAWHQWEQGDRRMHPAFFELFTIKTSQQQQGAAAWITPVDL